MEKKIPTLTVFTPTYNRAHTLPRTYESLRKQPCKDFLWLIIDDGSSDGTRELVAGWMNESNEFEIQYIYKENGGMHTAHNTAYEHITTELNVCIDSDDTMAENAVKKIIDKWETVKDKGCIGIIGQDADFDGCILGTSVSDDIKEITFTDYHINGGSGDHKLVYRTDVVKEFPPYPIFEGEKFVPLGYKYHMMDEKGKLAVLNEVLCNVEYQTDGSTKNMLRQYRNNPKGFAYTRKFYMQLYTSKRRQFRECIHYVAESILSGNRRFIAESPRKLMTVMAIPVGIMFTLYIQYRTK